MGVGISSTFHQEHSIVATWCLEAGPAPTPLSAEHG